MDPELVRIVIVAIASGTVIASLALIGKMQIFGNTNKSAPPAADAVRLEALEDRIAELEERVDFTDRLLSELRFRSIAPRDTPV